MEHKERHIHSLLFDLSGCISQQGLSNYTKGLLSPEEKKMVDHHCSSCEMCKDAIEGVMLMGTAINLEKDIRDIQYNIRKLTQYQRLIAKSQRSARFYSRLAILSAAASVFFIIGFFTFMKPSIKEQQNALALTEENNGSKSVMEEIILPEEPSVDILPTPPSRKEEKKIVIDDKKNQKQENRSKEKKQESNDKDQNTQKGSKNDDLAVLKNDDDNSPAPVVNPQKSQSSEQQDLPSGIKDADEYADNMEGQGSGDSPNSSVDDLAVLESEEKGEEYSKRQKEAQKVDKNDWDVNNLGGAESKRSARTKKMIAPSAAEEEAYEMLTVVEQMPRFRGKDIDAFKDYIQSNIRYPKEAMDKRIQGIVYVQFLVDKEGKITNEKVVYSVSPLLDNEALRVIQSSPDWEPGKQRGVPVDVRLAVPVRFMIDK